MRHSARSSIVFGSLLITALYARPAAAQELSVGYQFQRLSASGDNVNLPVGVNFDVAFPIVEQLEILGQVDWSRKTESTTESVETTATTLNYTAFGGGLRWKGAGSKATPFIQAVVGAMHSTFSSTTTIGTAQSSGSGSGNDAILQVGGGVAVPVGRKASVVGQVDYRRIFATGQGVNSVRVVAGMRFGVR